MPGQAVESRPGQGSTDRAAALPPGGSSLLERLSRETLVGDAAKGTGLWARGLAHDALPETWNLDRPDQVVALHSEHVQAGSDLLVTNTFRCNRPALTAAGLDQPVEQVA